MTEEKKPKTLRIDTMMTSGFIAGRAARGIDILMAAEKTERLDWAGVSECFAEIIDAAVKLNSVARNSE